MRIAFHAAADREAEEVADYYEQQLPGLGSEFYHELGTCAKARRTNQGKLQ